MRLLNHPEADQEFVEATRHYRDECLSRALRFAEATWNGLALIGENPYVGQKWGRRARGYVVKRFPYTIYYEIRPDYVLVAAFAHQSRRPGYWQKRLRWKPEV
jgi:toxin ParE1/3/4